MSCVLCVDIRVLYKADFYLCRYDEMSRDYQRCCAFACCCCNIFADILIFWKIFKANTDILSIVIQFLSFLSLAEFVAYLIAKQSHSV